MRIAGNYNFEASREEVWAALNDPEVLARTIPGCQKLEQVGDNEYETTLKVGLQAVRGTYNGRVRIEDIQPPYHYKIVVDGKGSNGFLKGEGDVSLHDDGPHTIMDYGGEAQVGGTIASVGQRLLDGAAKTLINQSLKALTAQIQERVNGTPEPEAPPEVRRATTTPSPANGTGEAVAEPVTAAKAASSVDPVSTAVTPPPPQPAIPASPQSASAFDRRNIVVPEHERLSEGDVARGMVEDFVQERPWFPWVVVAFLLGYLFGRGRRG